MRMVLFFAHESSELLKTKLMKLLNYSDMIFYKMVFHIRRLCKSNNQLIFQREGVFLVREDTLFL